jgi:hypothetical protein
LEALLRYDRPDEKIARAARRTDRERLQRLPVERAWLGSRRNELHAVITGLVDQANRLMSRSGTGSMSWTSMGVATTSPLRRW